MKKLLMALSATSLIALAACTEVEETTVAPEPKQEVEVKQDQKKEEKKEVKQETKKPAVNKNNPGISLAEFKEIKNGMSYEEVVKIVGGEGEVQSEVGEESDQYYTVAYSFQGEKGFGSNVILMFQGGKLNTKSQAGLK